MPVVVVHQSERVVCVFGGEAVGVRFSDVERREGGVGGRGGHRAERRILVVRRDASGGLVGHKVGNVLVAVVEVEDVVSPRDALHPQGAGGNWLGRIPTEGEVYRIVRRPVEPLNTEIPVIDESVVCIGDGVDGLDIFDATAHAVELHRDVRRTTCPQDGAIFSIVGDGPDAGGGLYERLVSVQIKLRNKVAHAFRDVHVLV